MEFTALSFLSNTIFTLPVLALATIIAIVAYRCTLHPLCSFPGPTLAAASGFFIFYHDVIKDGKLHLALEKLHDQYGPIVRIGPNELHVKHPEAYDQVYRPGYKVSKWSWYYSCFGVAKSSFGSLNNVEHGQRRAAISSFFSRQSVLSLDDVLSRPINKLRNRLETLCSQGPKAWCQLERAYRCISLDSMSEIAFGRSFAFLDQDDCGKAFHDGVEDSLRTICVIRHFPILVPVFNNMPLWVMRLAGEKLAAIRMMKEFARDAAKAALSKAPATSTRTILHEIVSNPDPRKTGIVTQRRLEEEALSLIAASSDTVGNALAAATYHLLRNPEANQRLVEELREAIPDAGSLREENPSYDMLAPLPWLTAVVNESLRMSHGLVGRLPRVVPHSGIEVLGRHIPGGSVISMSAYLQHNDSTVFPNPESFQPERWLDSSGGAGGSNAKHLSRYLVAFGKGSHGCVGSTMAYSLLYKTLATIHRSFEMRLEGGITDRDMEYEDHFVGLHRQDAVRLTVSVSSVYS